MSASTSHDAPEQKSAQALSVADEGRAASTVPDAHASDATAGAASAGDNEPGLAKLDSESRSRTVMRMQAQHGNQYVARLVQRARRPSAPVEQSTDAETARAPIPGPVLPVALTVQRWTMPYLTLKSDEELIKDADEKNDITAVKEIRDFNKANDKQKLKMLQLVSGQSVTWFRDNRAIRSLWLSFDGSFSSVASANIGLWKKTFDAQNDSGKTEMLAMGPIKKLKEDYPADIKAMAADYLSKNRKLITGEMSKLGLPESDKGDAPAQTQQQAEEMQKVQAVLEEVADAQATREALKQVPVGYYKTYDPTLGHERDPLAGGERGTPKPGPFNPDKPPDKAPEGTEQPPMQDYNTVKARYENLGNYISSLANKYPAVYAMVSLGTGKSADTAKVATANPAEARKVIGDAMRTVLKNIAKTEGKLKDQDFLFKLGPIERTLSAGTLSASKTKWNDALPQWVAGQVTQNYKDQQFWIDLGVGTLAAAAFVVAEIATLGTATFFAAAAVGVAASAAEVASKWNTYMDLSNAGKSAASDKTQIVDASAIDEAEGTAILASAMALLMAAGIAVKFVRGVAKVSIDFSKQLSASGFKGTLAGREGFGVFEGMIPGVRRPVAIKVYPENMAEQFGHDLAGAEAASRTGVGPKCYGEIPAGPGKRAFAMEKIEGGFVENMSTAPVGSPEYLAAQKQAQLVSKSVTQQTVNDIETFSQKLLKGGHYYDGEVQGLIDSSGRWRPIDFQPVRPLPPATDKAAYEAAILRHNDMIGMEKDQMARLAAKNSK